ncbi:DUF1822 family protein [Oscillatoria salina]|uniref:DUF1822 family protein n=1 Tax=Oscillatoria salina TaxID=331517 RepID=UPI001CCDE150|nr:DUF1822 family protein [Oscillatoria salina]MBZ8181780.1 DUF1822 family protein [Oscillatoria salina IIICB1]
MSKLFNEISQLRTFLPEVIPLEAEDYEQAINKSETGENEESQWQIYTHVLATLAFVRWLKERFGKGSVDNCSIFQPEKAKTLEAVYNLQVGEFKLCLILAENILNEEMILLPKLVIDDFDMAAHFYVVMAIDEEHEEAIVKGSIDYQKLIDYWHKKIIITDNDYYHLPLNLLDFEANHLLYYLRYLEPSAINLPVKSTEKISKKVVNVALWLQDEIDEITRSLNWSFPSRLSVASVQGFRSIAVFENAIAELNRRGLEIPHHARGCCRKIILANLHLQLLAATWLLPQQDNDAQEWSLLLLLAMQSGVSLPKGLRLQISDQDRVLSDKILEKNDDYFYRRLIGSYDDQFSVKITFNGSEETLEPLVFIDGITKKN